MEQSTVGPVGPVGPVGLEGMRRLVGAVQELSLARSLDQVTGVVRRAARELTGADGATFVLRERDLCHYADEDAIAPLWKGSRFPMSACISGWVMLHREPAVIEDIYEDPRVPWDAYRPTFVRSLAMVPIRRSAPIGAIGNYWADRRLPTSEQVQLLQALADSASCALESVQLYGELERRVAERTEQLEAANRELEAFAYSVSHDLRAPLRHVTGFSEVLARHAGPSLDDTGKGYLERIQVAVSRMDRLIEDLLAFSRAGRSEMSPESVDLASLVRQVVADLSEGLETRRLSFTIGELPRVMGDRALLRAALVNLLGNALKYTRTREVAEIEVAARTTPEEVVLSVRDNGVGFESAQAGKLFTAFRRLHTSAQFEGTGIGLATVRRIVERHGGRAWAEGEPDRGATFFLALPVTGRPTA
jgi:signal transduction histidine kinase